MATEPPPRLDDLERRLRAAGARETEEPEANAQTTSGIGAALRVTVDLVSGIGVGTFIGWVLDGWLDTRPWFMILFFVLGAAAGFRNVIRTAQKLEEEARRSAGRAKQEGKGD